MPFLKELNASKNMLLDTLLADSDFVNLVSGQPDTPLPALNLKHTQVFPIGWTDEAVSEAKTFVCFDIDVDSTPSNAVSNFKLFVWIFTHNTLIYTENGVLVDEIANRIDQLINGSTEMGFGKVKLESVGRWTPNADYYGRVLKYHIQGWNRCGSRL